MYWHDKTSVNCSLTLYCFLVRYQTTRLNDSLRSYRHHLPEPHISSLDSLSNIIPALSKGKGRRQLSIVANVHCFDNRCYAASMDNCNNWVFQDCNVCSVWVDRSDFKHINWKVKKWEKLTFVSCPLFVEPFPKWCQWREGYINLTRLGTEMSGND